MIKTTTKILFFVMAVSAVTASWLNAQDFKGVTYQKQAVAPKKAAPSSGDAGRFRHQLLAPPDDGFLQQIELWQRRISLLLLQERAAQLEVQKAQREQELKEIRAESGGLASLGVMNVLHSRPAVPTDSRRVAGSVSASQVMAGFSTDSGALVEPLLPILEYESQQPPKLSETLPGTYRDVNVPDLFNEEGQFARRKSPVRIPVLDIFVQSVQGIGSALTATVLIPGEKGYTKLIVGDSLPDKRTVLHIGPHSVTVGAENTGEQTYRILNQ